MNQVTAIDMPVHRFSSQSVKCFTIKAVKRSLSTQNYKPLVHSLSKHTFICFYFYFQHISSCEALNAPQPFSEAAFCPL